MFKLQKVDQKWSLPFTQNVNNTSNKPFQNSQMLPYFTYQEVYTKEMQAKQTYIHEKLDIRYPCLLLTETKLAY
jgi:hypothetical protein